MRAVVLDDQDAVSLLIAGFQQLLQLLQHGGRRARCEQQGVGASASCSQPRRHIVLGGNRQQRQLGAGALTGDPQHRADVFQFAEEFRIHHHQVGRQGGEHFLQFVGVFQQLKFIA